MSILIVYIAKIEHSELINKFLKILIQQNEVSLLRRIIAHYFKLANRELGIKNAIIYSAFSIPELKLKKIKDKLETKYGFQINLHHQIDEDLISGFKIVIDSNVIEQSYDLDLKKIETLLKEKRKEV